MTARTARRWRFLLPAACLLTWIGAEKAALIRTDSLAAAGCATHLFSKQPDGAEVVARNRAAIAAEAQRQDLPPEMLAAIVFGHQRGLTPFRTFTDCAGSALGADLSLGPAQVRISTAAKADGLDPDAIPPRQFKAYRAALIDPARNIAYQALELRQILDLDNRFPGLTAEALIRDPAAMGILMSEYRFGRQEADRADVRVGSAALWDLQHMLEQGVFVFGRGDAEAASIRTDIRAYLDGKYCGEAPLTNSACAWWQARAQDLTV